MNKECRDHLGNVYKSQKDMLAFYGITRSAFSSRLYRGMSLKDALTTPMKVKDNSELQKMGYSNYADLCRKTGIGYDTLRGRLKLGYTLDQAISSEFNEIASFRSKRCRPIVYKGKRYQSLKQLCRDVKISYNLICSRLNRGLTLDEAVIYEDSRNTLTYQGIIYKNKRDLCEKLNIPLSSYSYFYSKTNNIERAISLSQNSTKKNIYHFKGKAYSYLKDIWNDSDKQVTYRTFIRRVHDGFSIEDALNSSLYGISVYGKNYHSIVSCCKDLGISAYYFRKALKTGLSAEEAVEQCKKTRCSPIIYNGEKYKTVTELCQMHNITYATVSGRLSLGYTLEESLNPNFKPKNRKPVVFNGVQYRSITECCKKIGIPRSVVKDRIRSGWTLEKALSIPKRENNGNPVIYKGISYNSLRECCKSNNIDYKLVHSRINICNMTIEEAMEDINYHNKQIEVQGICYNSLTEACIALKKPVSLIQGRLAHGWSVEEAFTLPKHLYVGEYRVAECLKRLNIKFYHDCPIKTIFADLDISIDWNDFLSELQSKLGSVGYNWSKQKIQRLRPDFVLYTDEDNKIRGVIEFDGEQHQNFMEFFFKTIEEFLSRSNADFIKNSLWEYLRIPMLRIRHDQIDMIDNMVKDFIDNPQNYIHNHNTYLSEEEYWSILTEHKQQIDLAFA